MKRRLEFLKRGPIWRGAVQNGRKRSKLSTIPANCQMNVPRLGPRIVATAALVAACSLILLLTAVSGWLPGAGLSSAPALAAGNCGDSSGTLTPADASVFLDPTSGPAGSNFKVEMSGVPVNQFGDQPVEVLWDWSLDPPPQDVIGTGAIPQGAAATSLEATVPSAAPPGQHDVTVCWLHGSSETWYYTNLTFEVVCAGGDFVQDMTQGVSPQDLANALLGGG